MLNPYIEQSLLNRQYVECFICGVTKDFRCHIKYIGDSNRQGHNCNKYYGSDKGYYYGYAKGGGWYGDGDMGSGSGTGNGDGEISIYHDAKSIY